MENINKPKNTYLFNATYKGNIRSNNATWYFNSTIQTNKWFFSIN